MKKQNIELKPKKQSFIDRIKLLFVDKRKRYLYILLFSLPFIILIGIFGFISIKETKNIIDLAKGSNEIKDEYQIKSMGYSLRNNATEIQQHYFAELKNAIEVNNLDDEDIAGLVCKNFVADTYTWSNKQGQYDISSICYLYTGEVEKGAFNELTYSLGRDGFYKYLNTYINKYGASNLLEVENVNVTKASKANYPYQVKEVVDYESIDDESSTEVYGYVEYDPFEVSCNWTYKQNDKFDTSGYAKSMNFIVIFRNGRYEIVEANQNPIELDYVEIEEEEYIDEN